MKRITKPYRVILYYKFIKIENPEEYARLHLHFCQALDIRGRIIVAKEGINGTVSGTVSQTEAYIAAMRMDPRFTDIDFKIDEADGHAFKKMFVRARDEIVTLHSEYEIDPNVETGRYLMPEEFLKAMTDENTVIIDARNEYEYDLGHFRNAIRPDVRTFKEFPGWVKKNLDVMKGKKVLTYCTGGIRCEKFTGLLLKEGIGDVSQLKGGIINYSKDPATRGTMFEGKCYVFDERISVEVNHAEGYKLVGKCYHCGKPHDRFVNCAHLSCHFQFICCEECEITHKRSCSKECEEAEDHEWNLIKNQGMDLNLS
jgi:UPF0176 protein